MHGEITEKLLRINDVLRIIPVGKSTFEVVY